MDLFRTAAAVLLVTVMVATFCNGFTMTRMDPHSRFAVNSHIARLKMVTISRHPTAAEELIGIDSVIAAVDDLIFDIDDSADQEKVPPTAVNSFPLLLNAADVTEFSALLKQMAAKRRRLKESDRPALSSAVIERLDSLNDELFSDCIWSMGTLRCGLNDFAAISSTVKGKSTVQQFWDKVAQVSETADRLCITRLAIGLGKMGLRWDSLPSSTQASVIKLVTPSDSSIGLESRELATVLFTLGQLGVTTDLLPEGALPRVLDEMASIVHNFTPQGLSNALHGLARMGVLWTDLPVQAQSGLPMRGASIVKEMRPDELCSIMQSMAVMKVQWSSLPLSYRDELLTALETTLPNLNNRELSNMFWTLGKTNVDYVRDLSPVFKEILMDSLLSAAGDLKLFDLESVFVGLGLMQVNYDLLSADIQEYLIRLINQHLSEMNIFCTYNVLWGLARMGASKSSLGPALSSSVLDKTVGILHTFLPTHYGDVIWSLGSLGYRQDDLSPVMSDRVLAVLSRVYGKLHVRAAAYTLWGLSKMGFQWEDMQGRTRSLAGGREADPLSESVSKYLRQRVASMKEHEYSVLLYSLGGLRVQLQGESESSLPDYVTEKIHHRATRVSTFLTSRSLANSLYGLGKCGVSWMELPIETRDAWENAMLSLPASLSPSSFSNQKHGNNGDRKGLQGMRTVEFAQTLYGLGQLQVPWRNLLRSTREALTAEIQQHGRVDSMDLHGISTGLWGFAAMGCPLKEVPANLILAARKRLWAPGSVAEISALEFDRSIINQALSTPQPQVDSSTVVAAASDGKTNSAAINKDDYKLIERGEGSGRQHSSRRVVLTSLEECALSLTMGLEALAMLKAHLSQEELRGVAGRLQILAPHMGPDSIVTCTRSLSQLGALWTDLTTDTRVTWISRLKRSPGDLTAAKRQGLAESLNTMGAF